VLRNVLIGGSDESDERHKRVNRMKGFRDGQDGAAE
jgi:hypothetical protein